MGRGSFQGEDVGGFAARNLAAFYEEKEANKAIDDLRRFEQDVKSGQLQVSSSQVPEEFTILSQELQRAEQFRGPIRTFNPVPIVSRAKAELAERLEARSLAKQAEEQLGVKLTEDQARYNKQLIRDALKQSKTRRDPTEQEQQLQQQAQEKLGLDLSIEQVMGSSELVQEALMRTPSFTPSKRTTKISFEDLSQDYNKAVQEYAKISQNIQQEKNPIIFNARVQRELPDIENRIKTLGEDYTKLSQAVEKHQPKLIEVSDYGKYKNRFKGINVIKSRIASARGEIASEQDPYKKEAKRLIDEPNLANLERQLVQQEKQVKRDMAQTFVARGAAGQTPQIVGGPVTPYLVPTFRMPRQKSNMLAGLPDLGDVGPMVTQRQMKNMERNIMRQPKRKSKIDKFLDFNFGG